MFLYMNLNLVTNKEQWDKQIGSQKMSQFLQSWDWGEFQKSLGRKIWRLDLNGHFVFVIKMPLPLGQNYLYAPRINYLLNKDLIDSLKNLAKAEKSIFLRLELSPQQDLDLFGFKKVQSVQPKKTLLLDLSKNEAELLADMHQKTRYNIRLAEKKGVKVKISEAGLDDFYNLISSTYNRKGLSGYNKEYYQKLLANYSGEAICLAEFQDKILCANLVLPYGDTMIYLHGGSSEDGKNLMAPHLLQWEAIKKAKELGYKYYDFWGIEDRYPGVARFKRGFGGFEVDYAGAWDLPINKFWYLAYKIIKVFK